MSNHTAPQTPHASTHGGSVKQYVFGFLMSLILTLIPLYCVVNHVFAKTGLIIVIMAAAVVQMLIQLFFFMHVKEKQDDGPAWHIQSLILGVVIVITIVGGSVWVMSFSSQVQ